MGSKFVNVDRNTPMLLPCDLREWVHSNALVHFILDVVEQTDLSRAVVNDRGTGSRQYPPSMMLALLIYSYATKVFSSRQIENSTYDSMAVRYLCGNHHPDHDTIAKFRRENGPLIEDCFFEVLALAREMGLLRLGNLSVDGSKLKGNVSLSGQLTMEELEGLIGEMRATVTEAMERTREADRNDQGDAEGLLLPEELGERQARVEKLREARDLLQQRLDKLKESREKSRKMYTAPQKPRSKSGRKPDPSTQSKAEEKDRSNQKISVSDPESHRMPHRREGFVQGYNAQAGVCVESRLIVARRVSNQPNDAGELEPLLETLAEPERSELKNVMADKGYWSGIGLSELEEQRGIRCLVPPTYDRPSTAPPKSYAKGHPRYRIRRMKEKMRRRLRTELGRELFAKRAPVSEGVFSVIKRAMGFAEFRLRRLAGANTEWDLITIAYNCRQILATASR